MQLRPLMLLSCDRVDPCYEVDSSVSGGLPRVEQCRASSWTVSETHDGSRSIWHQGNTALLSLRCMGHPRDVGDNMNER